MSFAFTVLSARIIFKLESYPHAPKLNDTVYDNDCTCDNVIISVLFMSWNKKKFVNGCKL